MPQKTLINRGCAYYFEVFLSVREEEVLLLHQEMCEFVLSCFFDLSFWKASGFVCIRLGTSGKGWEKRWV
jgi:hypothetical protein